MQRVLIIGATSAIAQEVAKIYAIDGSQIFLVARNSQKLEQVAQDLIVRGADSIEMLSLDLADFERHEEIVTSTDKLLGGIDIALIAHGTLPDQKACEINVHDTLQELQINFLSTVSLLTLLANYFEKQGSGCIAVISSVAGDRGRQSNYVYGAAKGGLSIFLQGLRNRLSKAGICVLTIKPGFVITPMTAEFKKSILWAQPKKVANDIVSAIRKRKNVLYVPWFWRWIMLVILAIPENIFKRMSL
jgi:decaprenylphospho-beta-D-erythro-pentofuranosid-2-ulose 2-reductase